MTGDWIPKNPFIDSLELSVRAGNVLRAWGRVHTPEEFLALDRATVMALPRAGVQVWREIEQMQKFLRSLPHAAPAQERADNMSLRDAAALAAWQAILGRMYFPGNGTSLYKEHMEQAARAAWVAADAFIAAGEQKP